MARGRGTGRRISRRRPPKAVRGGGEDRISALPDDLLLLILRRVDTRTALGTASLSRRWSRLPPELPALDFNVFDVLPERYCGWLRLHLRIDDPTDESILANLMRYERRAMRALASFIQSRLLLDAPRRLRRLRLQFFSADNSSGLINRLVAKAIDDWGVSSLEAVATPFYTQPVAAHAFPGHGLCERPRASRLRKLKLAGCAALPPLHEHGALTKLVLQDMPESVPVAAYEAVLASCPQLQVLHLVCCLCRGTEVLTVDAPMSRVRELVVDRCEFLKTIRMAALPGLEKLASLGTRVSFESAASFPRLSQCNLAWFSDAQPVRTVLDFIGRTRTPDIASLIIRFTGEPERWIVPWSHPSSLLPNLTRLLVADVPSSWDVSWPRLLLEAAPSLETLHIHVAACVKEPGAEISWGAAVPPHHHGLKEFVMVGFEGTARQVYLVRFVMGACTALRCVAVFKEGHVRDKGYWDWEIIVAQPHSWTHEEGNNMLGQIMDGASSSAASFFG
ncbi:uncharacterized protein LOC119361340 [Triticum dicoccoides]|uniref:uncharacterized protein LOC119361340 n=1 Tax=Triticum dicoccoides TaxID=85692 RepID=UPI00188F1958|nr:uncharacterized protein LOC119361340 [Triticum dicoccoides]